MFSEINLFDKLSNGESRKQLLEIVKDTHIKKLCIPNTTFIDGSSSNIILPRVKELKLIHNFINPSIRLTNATLKA